MRGFASVVVAAAAATCLLASAAEAKVRIMVDLDSQTMHVEGKDKTFDWKVSSGKSGYETPAGSYGVLWMDKDHYSDEYDQAPMPNAIFFKPGFAIHGSYKSAWGQPASHGCVRLPVAKAAVLFEMVKAEGAEISIVGETPPTITAETPTRRNDSDAFYGSAKPRYAEPFYGEPRYVEPRNMEPRYAERPGPRDAGGFWDRRAQQADPYYGAY